MPLGLFAFHKPSAIPVNEAGNILAGVERLGEPKRGSLTPFDYVGVDRSEFRIVTTVVMKRLLRLREPPLAHSDQVRYDGSIVCGIAVLALIVA